MKIVIFDGTFATTTFINRLSLGLSKNHQVYILGFNETLKKPLAQVKYVKLGSNSNKFSFFKTAIKYAVSSYSPKLILKTFKLLLRFNKNEIQKQNLKLALSTINPDIIHAQWVSNLPILESILTDQKIPVILSQRGYHINVRPFVNKENMNYLKTWFPKIAGFHSVSKAIMNVGNQIYNDSKKINKVVYTGLNLENIPFNTNYSMGDKIKIISVGRGHWKKGYSYALEACRLLKNQNLDFEYEIIGVENDEELLFLRDDLDLKEEVKFISKVSLQEVYKMMNQVSVLLLPSIEEGIANVAVEAMALGTPVISTDCGGMEELILDEKEGWIVPTRNASDLANALIKLKGLKGEEINELRKGARQKVERMFTEELMVKGMEELYLKVLNQ